MRTKSLIIIFLLLFLCFVERTIVTSNAGLEKGYLVVTFDDGRTGSLTYAAPVLKHDGVKATMFTYVTSLTHGWEGFLNQSEMMNLQKNYSWEIQGHSHNHPDMNHLTSKGLQSEVISSKQELLDTGLRPISIFAYPYSSGDDNSTVVNAVRHTYSAARTAILTNATATLYGQNSELTSWCTSDCSSPDKFRLIGNALLNTTELSTAQAWIDQAIATHTVLVLVFHQIVNQNADAYSYLSSDFARLMDYARAKMDQGLLGSLYMSEAVATIFFPNAFPLWLLIAGVFTPVSLFTVFVARRHYGGNRKPGGIQVAVGKLIEENRLDPSITTCETCGRNMMFDQSTFTWICPNCHRDNR